MAKLTSIEGWIESNFETGAVTPATVRSWCRKGELRSKRMGGKWFVFTDANYGDAPNTGCLEADRLISELAGQL